MADEIALFPLSNVVLFPRVHTPLHLFEPRYRQMAARVLAGDRRIGMVVVPPEHQAEMAGDPPVYPIGCAGIVSQFQKLPDGRYNIVLVGTQRFRIREEPARPADRLYRVARVDLLEDPYPPSEGEHVGDLRARVVELVRELVQRSDPRGAARISQELFEGVDDATFVNTLACAFALPTVDKQGLLEAPTVPARFERLEGILSFRIAALRAPGAPDPQQLH